MFRQFTLYIDIVTSSDRYKTILHSIDAFSNICEPITNISSQFEKPIFMYDLLVIDYDHIDFENNMLSDIRTAYTTVIVLGVPNDQRVFELLYQNSIHMILKEGFFLCELESMLNQFMKIELLTNENTLLDNLFKRAQNSIVITDKRGNIQYANPYFENLTEYRSEELIHNSPNVIKTGQHSELFYKELWETINSGHVWEGVFINQSKNAKIFYEEATITPIQNTHGSIEKFLKIGKNITREKMLLEELSKEVGIAKKVLKTFLPQPVDTPRLKFDYHIADFLEIGGDFIYFNQVTENKYVLAMLDVMGHGVSSALVALTVAQKFHDQIYHLSLSEAVNEINSMLLGINDESSDHGKFLTGIFMEFDFENQLLHYINAGHPDVILLFKDGTVVSNSSNNMILGILPLSTISSETIDLSRMDKLLAFTDGMYENYSLTLDEAIDHFKSNIKNLEDLSNVFKENTEKIIDDATICLLKFE